MISRAGVIGAAAALALPLGGCAAGVLDPAGPVGAAERDILVDSLIVMLGIVLPVIAATLGFAWWYRASNKRARYDPDWNFSGGIEVLTWSVPAVIVLFLGGLAWIGSHALDPYRPLPSTAPPLEVRVVALDWKWLFIYPELGVATVNELPLPVGRPVNFRVTSATVMNSFFVPQLGSQIYAMAGMTTRLSLQADRPGLYRGISAHYSGDGFSRMHFTVQAMAPAQFDAWAAAARGQRRALDDRTYQAVAQRFVPERSMLFGAVAPGLFERIAALQAPPAAKAKPARDGVAAAVES